jgi:hypothetical protein
MTNPIIMVSKHNMEIDVKRLDNVAGHGGLV